LTQRNAGTNPEKNLGTPARGRHLVLVHCSVVPPGHRSTSGVFEIRLGIGARSSHPMVKILLCSEQASTAGRCHLVGRPTSLADGCSHLDRASHNFICPKYGFRNLLHDFLRESTRIIQSDINLMRFPVLQSTPTLLYLLSKNDLAHEYRSSWSLRRMRYVKILEDLEPRS
jgi:hypothetical protein